VARARARGSIACGLTTQLVMRAGPSRAFDGVERWGRMGVRREVGCTSVSVGLGGPLDPDNRPLVHHLR
jgi:hypothetical protein